MNPSITKMTGIYVELSVGNVFFQTENAFQKFWNAQTDEVKANLLVHNLDTEPASSKATKGIKTDQDSQSGNQP